MTIVNVEPGQEGNPLEDAIVDRLKELTGTTGILNGKNYRLQGGGEEDLQVLVVSGERDGLHVVSTFGVGALPTAGNFKNSADGTELPYRAEFYTVVTDEAEVATAGVTLAKIAGLVSSGHSLPPGGVVKGLDLPEEVTARNLFITPTPLGVVADSYNYPPIIYNEEFGVFFMNVTFLNDEEAGLLDTPDALNELREAFAGEREDLYTFKR